MCAAASFTLAAVSYLMMGRYPRHNPDGPEAA
jgi:hypothetical protein